MDRQSTVRFLGSRELFRWLSDLSQQILGITGREFVAGYRRGDFTNVPVARNLAAVLPFIEETDAESTDAEVAV